MFYIRRTGVYVLLICRPNRAAIRRVERQNSRLRADLAADLRVTCGADKLEAVRAEATPVVGASVPIRPPADTPLFNVPDGLSSILS